MVLPVVCCAQGTTSLESFHLHLARFTLGSSASAVNYQAYVLDGITRWNTAGAEAALNSLNLRTFSSKLKGKVGPFSRLQ